MILITLIIILAFLFTFLFTGYLLKNAVLIGGVAFILLLFGLLVLTQGIEYTAYTQMNSTSYVNASNYTITSKTITPISQPIKPSWLNQLIGLVSLLAGVYELYAVAAWGKGK